MLITKRKYPWIGQQAWSDVLFLHWPMEEKIIRQFVPASFIIDTYDGNAWISIVVFNVKNSLIRGLPAWTSYKSVIQINVRTYVYDPARLERGVYFFALRVNDLLAALGANTLFGLPFYHVVNTFYKNDKKISVSSMTENASVFSVHYEPQENVVKNDLAAFLTERYCIWNIYRNRIVKIPIRHSHWNLREVDVHLSKNYLFSFLGDKDRSDEFTAYYSPFKQAMLYPYEKYVLY
ncbi:DUF2071 domain-containing protein [Pseudogracilibacillus sp. SO30301A]|uniref:DUF2071 domain-containing protein n=1 Tax=Pseudogracilibacillus sp. SO30301A TaxID=3098291 RepID=UPI00300DF700